MNDINTNNDTARPTMNDITTNNDTATVKPLILNTSKEFLKCRLDNFSMSFILFYVNISI